MISEKTQQMAESTTTDVRLEEAKTAMRQGLSVILPVFNQATAILSDLSSEAIEARLYEEDPEVEGKLDNYENRIAACIKVMEEAKEANKKAIRAWDFIERDLGAIRTIVAAKVEAGEVAVEPLVEVVFTPSPSAVLNG
jgi:hypothetical protein